MSLGKLCHGGQGKWGRYNTFPDYLPIGLQLPYAEEGLGEVVCVVAERSGCGWVYLTAPSSWGQQEYVRA